MPAREPTVPARDVAAPADEPRSLAEDTTLGVGGPARSRLRVAGRSALLDALNRLADRSADELLVLGRGSNVIVSDAGWSGTVLLIDGGEITVAARHLDHLELVVDAGVEWDDLVSWTVERGLTGLELTSGIPGRVGAAPVQNVAAYGQQVCDVLLAVEVFDRQHGTVEWVDVEDCHFGFRTSRFKTDWLDQKVVVSVRLRLAHADRHPPEPSTYVDIERWFERTGGDPRHLEQRRAAILATRAAKSMLADPTDPLARSVGSFFINPTVPRRLAVELAERFQTQGLRVTYLEGRASGTQPSHQRIPAALLLRSAGFSPGDSWGPVQLSDRHVLALVTRPGARAEDVWCIGHHLRDRVAEATGVTLHIEPRFVGEFPEPPREAEVTARYRYEAADTDEPDWLRSYR